MKASFVFMSGLRIEDRFNLSTSYSQWKIRNLLIMKVIINILMLKIQVLYEV